MESTSRSLLWFAPGLMLLVVAYTLGRWHGRTPPPAPLENASDHAPAGADDPAHPIPPAPVVDPAKQLQDRIDAIIVTAQRMLRPNAKTMAFFENLGAHDAAIATEYIAQLPSSNERDLLLVMAIRRWAEHDAPAALARANRLEVLPQRGAARAAVYEAWGMLDAEAAFAHAVEEPTESDRWRALAALLAGAAAAYPGGAITLWEGAPEAFRNSNAGGETLDRIVNAADGTGQREAMQAIVRSLPPGRQRARLVASIARHWGVHDPEAAVAWVESVVPEDDLRGSIIDEVFSAFVRRDPVRAAAWGIRQTDERRRTNYVAAAVAEWATYDAAAAETWVNEQQTGPYLDGATYAMAAHFIERRHLQRAFAWTRRIVRNETRAELLGNLGRIWHEERPQEFDKFLAETSLNRAEVEMLKSKIVEIDTRN